MSFDLQTNANQWTYMDHLSVTVSIDLQAHMPINEDLHGHMMALKSDFNKNILNGLVLKG